MNPPKHRFAIAALSTVLAAALMLAAGAAAGQACPSNFFAILESKNDTTASKQDIGNACRGREVTVRGTVVDVAKRGDFFELHLLSVTSGNNITVNMRDAPGTDLSQLRKGMPVVVAANLRDFSGLQNEYLVLDDGSCQSCGVR